MTRVSSAGNVVKHVRVGIALSATQLQQDIRVVCNSAQPVDECRRLEYSFTMTSSRDSIHYEQKYTPYFYLNLLNK